MNKQELEQLRKIYEYKIVRDSIDIDNMTVQIWDYNREPFIDRPITYKMYWAKNGGSYINYRGKREYITVPAEW